MSDDYDWRADAYACWLLALELARDGHEGLRAVLAEREEPA
jgi:hypothetical protein